MRRVAAVAMCGLALAMLASGCGDSAEPALPAAATDTSAREAPLPAKPSPPAEPPASAKPIAPALSASSAKRPGPAVLQGRFERLNGESVELGRYAGRVVLVVNTATECGYTPQFQSLEALYRERRGDGLVVLGFPANDFAGQEPRSDKEIATFCKANYGVSFPMFSKSHVTGDAANARYRRLNVAAGEPEWNFNKVLIDRRGRVVVRFGAGTEPQSPELTKRLDALLAARA